MFLYLALLALANGEVTLTFNSQTPQTTVDPSYINYNIDTGSLFNGMNFSDTKFRTLVSQLAPAVIRIGGTAVDSSFWFPDTPYLIGQVNSCPTCGSGASAIGMDMMTQIIEFMQATNMSLLWDLNGEKTRDSPLGPWNPAVNATPFFTWLDGKYGGAIDFAYSVGNEPNLWSNKVSSEQLARDAVTLKNLLKNYNVGQKVFGPSWAGVSPSYAAQFLPISSKGGVDGYTVHDYPYGGKDCNVTKYLDKTPITTNLFNNLQAIAEVAASTPGAQDTLLTLEEVACSSGGGCENVTDVFMSGFAWLTTMNTVAKSGFHRVHRQDIAGWSFAFGMSHYMLVGPAGWVNGSHDLLVPHPDYYTTVLFRQLMGTRYLASNLTGGSAGELGALDVNVWCSGARSPVGEAGVVVSYVNFQGSDVQLQLPPSLAASSGTLFHLSALPDGTTTLDTLQVNSMYLNGVLMTVDVNGNLPTYPLPGVAFTGGGTLPVPAFTYGFLVLDYAAAACAA